MRNFPLWNFFIYGAGFLCGTGMERLSPGVGMPWWGFVVVGSVIWLVTVCTLPTPASTANKGEGE
jgi:hypothetical protein